MVNGMTKEMELEKKEEEGLNLADYGFMFLSHWYWFVASVVVAMVIAVYYIMSTTPIYTTSTQLLIRDDKNSKGASTSIQDFSDLSLIKSNTNIKNEILTISAPIMMQETASACIWICRWMLSRASTGIPCITMRPLCSICQCPWAMITRLLSS